LSQPAVTNKVDPTPFFFQPALVFCCCCQFSAIHDGFCFSDSIVWVVAVSFYCFTLNVSSSLSNMGPTHTSLTRQLATGNPPKKGVDDSELRLTRGGAAETLPVHFENCPSLPLPNPCLVSSCSRQFQIAGSRHCDPA
ncbi:hypothetical protein EDB81DRAFT_778152, partial [Dactylonectria macrodidyma]